MYFRYGKNPIYYPEDFQFMWMLPVHQEVFCQPQYTAFPFDKLDIELQLLWYDGQPGKFSSGVAFEEVEIIILEKIFPDVLFIPRSEIWTYQNQSMDSWVKLEEFKFGSMVGLTFIFPLIRKVQYYIWTIFFPLELLMMLQLGTFIIPPDQYDRGIYSITVNLAFAVTQQVISGQMPKTSETIYFFIYIAAYLTIGIFITIYTLLIALFSHSSNLKFTTLFNGRLSLVRTIDLLVLLLTTLTVLACTLAYFTAVFIHNNQE